MLIAPDRPPDPLSLSLSLSPTATRFSAFEISQPQYNRLRSRLSVPSCRIIADPTHPPSSPPTSHSALVNSPVSSLSLSLSLSRPFRHLVGRWLAAARKTTVRITKSLARHLKLPICFSLSLSLVSSTPTYRNRYRTYFLENTDCV